MRIGTFSTYRRVLAGLRQNQFANVRAQEQLASGRRILRPSDDPTGSARAIRLERQLSDVNRYRRAITQGLSTVDAGAGALGRASGLMIDARELILQGMNGTLQDEDRESLAAEFDFIRSQMLEIGNERSAEKYLFGGTLTDRKPWEEITQDGRTRVVYRGNGSSQVIRVGESIDVEVTLPGVSAFGEFAPTGTSFGGLSGAAGGTTADEGTGYVDLLFRHESTDPGSLASVGIALVNGGAGDSVLGDNQITIDPIAGTIRLGSGTAVQIPDPASADLVVKNELGAELHLDLTGYDGSAYTGTVSGAGSVSLDGVDFTSIDFTETNLELSTDDTVLHIDTTGVKRSGSELVEFQGSTNVFDLMGAIADDLRNDDNLDGNQLIGRLNSRLEDLDRHHQNILVSASTLGSHSQRLRVSDSRSTDVEVQLQTLLSEVADADLAEVALELEQSQYLLQLAQAAGARVLQTSLLNFLG